jgi:PKD domain
MTLHLFVLSPRVVFAARVDGTPSVYPIQQIAYDSVTAGDYSAALSGMTVMVGTTPGGDELGRQRLRNGSTFLYLKVALSSRGTRAGELYLQDNAYVTVLDLYEVWSRPPYIAPDGTIYKDGDNAVSTWTIYPPPVANMRPGFAATIGLQSVAGKVRVAFTGEDSFCIEGLITNYFWDIGDGEFVSGSETSVSITADFPPGFRWVSLTVTNDHGATHTARAPVYARDPANDTTVQNFEVVNHRITHEGQQISFRILDPLPRATYPDGTLVLLWEEDGSVIATLSRGHMHLIGWHVSDPTQYRAERSGLRTETVLDCVDVAGRLDRLPGYTQLVEGFDASSVAYSPAHPPTAWTQMSNITLDKFIHYLLHWHSTALTLADYTPSGTGTVFALGAKDADGASLWDQLARLAQNMTPDYHAVCNRLGVLALRPDPMLMPVASRPATVQQTLNADAWAELQFTYTRPPRVHILRSGALQAGFTADPTALFCVAPGTAWGQGESEQEISEKVVSDQTSLNASEGNRYARLNARYSRVRMVWARTWNPYLEPADLTWVEVDFPAAQRGVDADDARGLVWEVSIRYEHTRTGLARQVELLWERETSGPPATSTNDLWVPI